MKKGILAVVTVLLLLFIWGQSAMTADLSSKESGYIYALIRPYLELVFGQNVITHELLRKCAHFGEYFLLGMFICTYACAYISIRFGKCMLGAVAVTWTAAFLDETIQIFSNRGPMIQDVWLDLAGAAAGIIVVGILAHIIHMGRIRKAKRT